MATAPIYGVDESESLTVTAAIASPGNETAAPRPKRACDEGECPCTPLTGCQGLPTEPESERVSSTHKVEVVPLVLEKHPNADRLSVATIFGFTCVVATDQWAGHDKAAYLPPDSTVDVSREEFSFLAKDAKADGKARIKAKKLRGVLSFGLLVPAPPGSVIGDDVAAQLAVGHYDPPPAGAQKGGGLITGGETTKAPDVYCVKYDLEAGRRYAQQVMEPGEPCVVTEKVHGCLRHDTLVTMADGSKKVISGINAGERVMSYNQRTEVFEPKKVLAAIVREPDDRAKWLKMTMSDGNRLVITSNHLMLTHRGWVEAGMLTTEDMLISW